MKVWIFDVDGVITNKETQKVDDQILAIISGFISSGDKVAFITGRSFEWLEKEVLDYLEKKIEAPSLLDNIYAVSEFGGVCLKHKNGKEEVIVEKNLTPPVYLRKEVSIIANDFLSSAWIEEKKTIITVAIKIGYSLEKFKKDQEVLISKFEELLEKYNLREDFEIQVDPFAVNIRNKNLNKSIAVGKVIRWLGDNDANTLEFCVFGDSKSDLEMGEELFREKKNFKFIFVGEKENIEENFIFDIFFTNEHFEKGTLEYLKSKN